MISATGRNLSVIIVTETGKDWQTFATWYSFYKNLPEAKLCLYCHTSEEFSFSFFQWAKRLKLTCLKQKEFAEGASDHINWMGAIKKFQDLAIIKQPILVVQPLVMAIDVLNNQIIKKFENKKVWKDECALYLNDQNVEELINKYYLEDYDLEPSEDKICFDAKLCQELYPLVTYRKGCGKWIDKSKGCPFSSAAGLITSEVTANETRIIELWKKMVPLYQVLN